MMLRPHGGEIVHSKVDARSLLEGALDDPQAAKLLSDELLGSGPTETKNLFGALVFDKPRNRQSN